MIFLATPHQGSYVAGSWLAQQVARLIIMPADMTRLATDFVRRNPKLLRPARLTRLATSVDQMTPGSPLIEGLSGLPIAPGVAAHSIIPVEGDGPYEEAADDVVAYRSAHIEGVASEVRARSGHPVRTIRTPSRRSGGSSWSTWRRRDAPGGAAWEDGGAGRGTRRFDRRAGSDAPPTV